MEGRIDAAVLQTYPRYGRETVDLLLKARAEADTRKIIVLDDDPTGVGRFYFLCICTAFCI